MVRPYVRNCCCHAEEHRPPCTCGTRRARIGRGSPGDHCFGAHRPHRPGRRPRPGRRAAGGDRRGPPGRPGPQVPDRRFRSGLRAGQGHRRDRGRSGRDRGRVRPGRSDPARQHAGRGDGVGQCRAHPPEGPVLGHPPRPPPDRRRGRGPGRAVRESHGHRGLRRHRDRTLRSRPPGVARQGLVGAPRAGRRARPRPRRPRHCRGACLPGRRPALHLPLGSPPPGAPRFRLQGGE